MPQVKRLPEDPKLFEQLLLTRAVAVIAGQPETLQLPSRECVHSLLTNDEIETAIVNHVLQEPDLSPRELAASFTGNSL